MRWLLAAMLSFLLHGVFFTIHFDWIKARQKLGPKSQTIAVELSYKKPERPSFVLKTHPVSKPPEKKHSQKIEKKNPEAEHIEQNASRPIPLETALVHDEIPSQIDARSNQKESSGDLSGQDVSTGQGVDDPGHLSGSSGHNTDNSVSAGYGEHEAIPEYKDNPPPVYPRIARRKGYQGTVILEVLVNQNGKVEDLRVYQSSGYPSLDDAASTSVFQWTFLPGMKENKPVEMWVKLPVRFQLQ